MLHAPLAFRVSIGTFPDGLVSRGGMVAGVRKHPGSRENDPDLAEILIGTRVILVADPQAFLVELDALHQVSTENHRSHRTVADRQRLLLPTDRRPIKPQLQVLVGRVAGGGCHAGRAGENDERESAGRKHHEAFTSAIGGGFQRASDGATPALTPNPHMTPSEGHGARCRVRTCDPIRVKDVLYH